MRLSFFESLAGNSIEIAAVYFSTVKISWDEISSDESSCGKILKEDDCMRGNS